MNCKRIAFALAMLALAGACVKVEPGPPSDLPAYAQTYPGAIHVDTVTLPGKRAVRFLTTDDADQVIDYYRGQATKNGLVESGDPAQWAGGLKRQVVFREGSSGRTLAVNTETLPNGTIVYLRY